MQVVATGLGPELGTPRYDEAQMVLQKYMHSPGVSQAETILHNYYQSIHRVCLVTGLVDTIELTLHY